MCQKSVIECHLRLKEALGSVSKSVIECHLKLKELPGSVSKECHRVSSQIERGTGKCVERVSSSVISD